MTGSELLTIYEIVTAIICAFLPFVVLFSLLKKRDDGSFYKFSLYVQMTALGALVAVCAIKYGVLGFSLVFLPICSLATYVFGKQEGYLKGYDRGYKSGFNDNDS